VAIWIQMAAVGVQWEALSMIILHRSVW